MAEAKDFPSRETAENAIQWVKDNANDCPVENAPGRSGPALA